jgi:hypothetical protein
MDVGNDLLLRIEFATKKIDQAHSSDTVDAGDQPYRQGMPVKFIKTFCLEQVFLPKYEEVEFDLALHALDYLQDLECTRRGALRDAANRLGITKHNWEVSLADDPNARAWVKNIQFWCLGLEMCYSELFVGLRIWV